MFFHSPQNNSINVAEAKERMNNPDVVWLDVREIIENEQIRIPDSIVIPMGLLPLRESELESVRDKEIIVYCKTGSRSYHTVRWLNDRGYNAKNMVGGIVQWSLQQFPVLKGVS